MLKTHSRWFASTAALCILSAGCGAEPPDTDVDGGDDELVAQSAQAVYSSDSSCSSNQALAFSSASMSYVGAGALPIPQSFTVEAWVKPSASGQGTYRIILAEDRYGQGANQFRLQVEPSNRVSFLMTDAGAQDGGLWTSIEDYQLRSTTSLPADAWTHVAVTKSGTAFTLLINGVAESTYQATQDLVHGGGLPFRIGGRVAADGTSPDSTFDGLIDEVRVWSTARSAAEIAASMDTLLTASDPAWASLLSYYRFDEGSGATAVDEKGAHPGTLVNNPGRLAIPCRHRNAAEVIIDVGTTDCNTNVAINNAIGQSFKVPVATALDHIDIWIRPELYYVTSYDVEVYDGEGTTGAMLATSATVTMESIHSTGGTGGGGQATWYSFSFAGQGLILQGNHSYTFRLVRQSPYSGAFSACGDVYPDGQEYWLGSSAMPHEDVSFRLSGL